MMKSNTRYGMILGLMTAMKTIKSTFKAMRTLRVVTGAEEMATTKTKINFLKYLIGSKASRIFSNVKYLNYSPSATISEGLFTL